MRPGNHPYQSEYRDSARNNKTTWRTFALCAQTDPNVFYPEKGVPNINAKKVCGNCEVREQCLAWALETNEEHGVWGGLSPRERNAIIKAQQPTHARKPMSTRDQKILQRFKNGWPISEIAKHLGTSDRTVHRVINKAREAQDTEEREPLLV